MSRAELARRDAAAVHRLTQRPLTPSARALVAERLAGLGVGDQAAEVAQALPLAAYPEKFRVTVGAILSAARPTVETDMALVRLLSRSAMARIAPRDAKSLARWIATSGLPVLERARMLTELAAAAPRRPDGRPAWSVPPMALSAEMVARLPANELKALAEAPVTNSTRLSIGLRLAKLRDRAAARTILSRRPLESYPPRRRLEVALILAGDRPGPAQDALLAAVWPLLDTSRLTRAQAVRLGGWVEASGLGPLDKAQRLAILDAAAPVVPAPEPAASAGAGDAGTPVPGRAWQMRPLRVGPTALEPLDRSGLVNLAEARITLGSRLAIARRLDAFGHGASALTVLRAVPLGSYPRAMWSEIGAMVAARDPDDEVEALLDTLWSGGGVAGLDPASAQRLVAWIAASRRPLDERLARLSQLAQIDPGRGKLVGEWRTLLRRTEFDLRRADNQLVDVLTFVPERFATRIAAQLHLPFLAALRLEGHDDRARALIAALRNPADPEDFARRVHMLRHYPGEVDIGDLRVPATTARRLRLTAALAPVREMSDAHEALLQATVAALAAAYPQADLAERAAILSALILHDFVDRAQQLAASDDIGGDLILARKALAGWRQLAGEDFAAAAATFRAVLTENPQDEASMAAFRFAAVRAGEGFEAAVDLRAGQGIERTRRYWSTKEQVWDLRAQGRFDAAAAVQAQEPVWSLLARVCGPRFLTDQDFDSLDPTSRVLIIASKGVGDEIRSAKTYGRLLERFPDITATCDPRLEGLFRRAFPGLRLVPCWRTRYGLVDRLDKLGDRIPGWNGLLYPLLNAAAAPHLERADLIVTQGYLQRLDAFDPAESPDRGPYLYPRSDAAKPPRAGGRPLQVGLLWRSHLVLRERRWFYLPHEALEGLLGIGGVEYHSVQHRMSPAERDWCVRQGIAHRDDLDMFDDLEGLADHLATLDLVIGISSVPAELAAALGVPVWFLGFSPENYLLRTGGGRTEIDQLTANARVIAPPGIDFSRPARDCIAATIAEARRRLARFAAGDAV